MYRFLISIATNYNILLRGIVLFFKNKYILFLIQKRVKKKQFAKCGQFLAIEKNKCGQFLAIEKINVDNFSQ